MSVTIVSSLIFANKRKAMQLFPKRLTIVWNEWELRVMVLISLCLQVVLILIGNWRKHSTSNKLRIVLWLAYLSADSVASVSLGILCNNEEDPEGDSQHPNSFIITAFWAPFLLLHLGGPDTITAYSLEDNELWLRHLLGLVVQVSVAFYVFLRAWSSKMLNFLAIPIFIVGVIKFGERTWVLRSASSEHFRDSMLQDPDPCPNYARYMEEYSSKRSEGFRYRDLKGVSKELKNMIFEQLQQKSRSASNFEACKQLCARRGDWVLENEGCLDKLGWSIDEVEFDQSNLLWHIAIDICYHFDLNRNLNPDSNTNCEASKLVSNYMLYLLVMCPFMLPNGIGLIRFRDTCAEAEEFFKEKRIMKSDTKQACTKLYNVCTDILPSKVKGDRNKSVLFDACRLAKALQSLKTEENWYNQKWELMSQVWVEMLSYAAISVDGVIMLSSSGEEENFLLVSG